MECSVVPKTVPSDVILHAFDWPYTKVTKQAEQISQLGYKSVLVSPPMKSLKHSSGTKWWQRYQPQDYRVIDNQLGNTQDFTLMVNTLCRHGLLTYVDVVFNHMANESDIREDLTYPNALDLQSYQSNKEYFEAQKLFGDLNEPLFTESDFVEAFGIKNWRDKWQVQNGRITGGPKDPGLPTLLDNDYVVKQQQAYLTALKEIGVKGFRIDAAKHMTIDHLKKVWTDAITHDVHIFGEIITDGGATQAEYELFLEPYLKHTRLGAYDFPLFNTIAKAFTPKGSFTSLIDPYCFGQALSNRRAITFTVTHDIPNNDVFMDHIMEEDSERLAYAYILGRDGGVPLIYSDLDTSGITDRSGQPRWQDQWESDYLRCMIMFHNYVHGEKMKMVEANDDLLVFTRGHKGIVIINKSVRSKSVSMNWSSSVNDALTGRKVNAEGGVLRINVEPKSSMMLM